MAGDQMNIPNRYQPQGSRGVTLIELVITIAVLAVLAAIAAPSFVQFFEKSRLRGAADEVVSLVANARGAAVKVDREVAVRFMSEGARWCVGAAQPDPGGTPGELMPSATACDCLASPGDCIVSGNRMVVAGEEFRGVTLEIGNDDRFVFDGKSGTKEPLAVHQAQLSTENFDIALSVSPLGQPSTCVPQGSNYVIYGLQPC